MNPRFYKNPIIKIISKIFVTKKCGQILGYDTQYTMPPDRPWGMPYNFTPEGYIPPASEAPKVTMYMRPPEGYKPLEIEVPRATAMGFAQQNAEIPRSAIMASPRPIMHTFPPQGGQVYHH